jgi:hypothetical protein
MTAAAREIDLKGGTVRDWLRTPGAWLRTGHLEKVAAFLRISLEEAMALQGGTVDEKLSLLKQVPDKWEESFCLECHERFSHLASEPRSYCSLECYHKSLEHRPTPKTPLAHFLAQERAASGMNESGYAASVGISVMTFHRLVRNHLPTARTYERLKERYDDRLPLSAIANDLWKERGRKLGSTYGPLLHTPEAEDRRIRAVKKALKGTPKSAAWKEKVQAVRKARGDQWHAGLLTYGASPEGRVQRSLTFRLHGRKSGAPKRADLLGWAQEVGQKYDLPPSQVWNLWQPYLWERGLLSKAGRKRNEDRHLFVENAMVAARKKFPGLKRLVKGFWDSSAVLLTEDEGKSISGPDLYRWWRLHKRVCPKQYVAAAYAA